MASSSGLYAVSHKKLGPGTLSVDASTLPPSAAASSSVVSANPAALETITFTPSTGPTISFTISTISHKYSPETDNRHMMRLECNPPVNGTKLFVFNFTTRADLTAVRDLVNDSMRRAGSYSRTTSPVPPSSKAKRAAAPEDAGFVQPTPKRKKVSAAKSITDKQQIASARAQLLASNTELKAHHNELVVGGVVDEEDFWAQHQSAVADEKAKLKGAASKFLVANSLESTVPTKGIVKLTKEQMYHIFKMYPAVLEAYKDRVQTNEVAEREFWAQYFKSAYYHRDKASGQRSGVIVDDDFSRVEDQLRRREENNPRGVKKLAKNDFDLTQTLSVERPLGLRAGSGNQVSERPASKRVAREGSYPITLCSHASFLCCSFRTATARTTTTIWWTAHRWASARSSRSECERSVRERSEQPLILALRCG